VDSCSYGNSRVKPAFRIASQPTRLSSRPQFDTLRKQLGHHEGLPFLEFLSRPLVEQACRHGNHPFRDRVYTPWVTLGIFLSQILSEDQSCDDALEHFQKFRSDQGLPAVASKTTSSCEARRRLPEELVWDLVAGPGTRSSTRRATTGCSTAAP
jgi:hypothetical protein